MSNTIGTVFYGFPLTDEIQELYQEAVDDYDHPLYDHCDEETFSCFESLYAAYSSNPIGYFGKWITILNSNEGSFVSIEDLNTYKYQLTQELVDQVKEEFNSLPQEIQDLAHPLDLYIIWSST
jgi:hypothetical protein